MELFIAVCQTSDFSGLLLVCRAQGSAFRVGNGEMDPNSNSVTDSISNGSMKCKNKFEKVTVVMRRVMTIMAMVSSYNLC